MSNDGNASIKLTETFRIYEQILNGASLAVVRTDPTGLITTFSRGAALILGYAAKDVENLQSLLLFHLPEELDDRAQAIFDDSGVRLKGFGILTAEVSSGAHITREWTYMRKDRTTFPVQLSISEIPGESGTSEGFLISITDISKLKYVEREVKSLLHVTKEQNERLLNFAHIVSHNLRSHSGNFAMLLSLFRMEYPEIATTEMIRHLNQASDNLAEVISHLTDVVHLNAQAGNGLEPMHLSEAVERSVIGVKKEAEQAGVKIVNLVPTSCRVQAVPAYVDSILLNLLANSIKYRHPSRTGEVCVSARIEKKQWVLTVQDNGSGIDLNRHGGKLFGMYKTFHGNPDARGIGLFISKNQVQAMGGEITLDSEPNVGTTIKIKFL